MPSLSLLAVFQHAAAQLAAGAFDVRAHFAAHGGGDAARLQTAQKVLYVRARGRMQVALTPLIDALFSEINPIPVKQALSLMGIPAGLPRLPLTPLSATHLPALEQALSAAPEP